MLNQVIFTKSELVEMLQGNDVELNDGVSHIRFSMEKEKPTIEEIEELLSEGKKTPNQIRVMCGLTPINDMEKKLIKRMLGGSVSK